MKKYEYLEKSDLDEKEINELGSEGWELINAVTGERREMDDFEDYTIFYFKREK